MDLKRYERITGREALKRMLDGEHVYFTNLSNKASSFFFDNNDQLKGETEAGEIFKPEVTVTEIIERYNWYIKKPFDVRTEMLARPNEWVAAYKSDVGTWYKVGFDYPGMSAVEVALPNNDAKPHYPENKVFVASEKWINKCIPIEDVPEEELT